MSSNRPPAIPATAAPSNGAGNDGEGLATAIDGNAGANVVDGTEKAMQGLFGRDSIYLLVWGLQVGVAALSIPVTTRLLGAGFSVVTTSLAVLQVLVAIGVFSLPPAVQRNYRETDGGADARRIVTLTIVTATITLVVAMATGPYWSGAVGLGNFSAVLHYAVIWASLSAVTFSALALLRSRDMLFAYGLVSLMQSVVAVGVGVVLIVFVRRTATEFVLGEMLTQGVAMVLALYLTRPLPIRRRHLKLVRDTLKYSGALVPAAIAGFLLTASDRLIINHDLPQAMHLQVARYGAVYNIASVPILLLGLLDTVWLPRFFSLADDTMLSKLLADSRDALYGLLIPAVLALSFSAPLVLSLWLQPRFHPAGLVFVVVTISVGGFPMAGFFAANRVLLISGKTGPVAVCVVTSALVNIALNVVLVPVWGVEGSALSTLVAYMLLHALVVRFARRIRHLRRPPPRRMISCAAAVAVAAVAVAVPSHGLFAVARVLATLASLAVFGVVLQRLISPGKETLLLRAVGWANARR
jgi:O-antigen/teichoic acid export membrane protein